MGYTVDTVPHLCCRYCKFFNGKAHIKGQKSDCKRIDHKKVKFGKSPFMSYHCGENHTPCRDFEPANLQYADFKDWTCMDDVYPVFKEAWIPYGKPPEYLCFVLNDDFDVDYLVPYELFYNGGMIKDGKLMAEYKRFTVRDKVDRGVQLYKLVYEKIDGVEI